MPILDAANKRALVFDLDETLADSLGQHERAFDLALQLNNRSLKELGEKNWLSCFGMRISDIVAFFYRHFENMRMTEQEFLQERERIFMELVEAKMNPMPGFDSMMINLPKTRIRLALASSGTTSYVSLCLRKLGLSNSFEAVVTGDDVVHGKPHPEIYLLAAKRLGLAPRECIAVEDSEHGVTSAKDAGMSCIAIHNPALPLRFDLRRADVELPDLAAIPACLFSARTISIDSRIKNK